MPARSSVRSTARSLSRVRRAQATSALLNALDHTDDAEERERLVDQVVLINREVADAVANRYRGRGIDLDDLHQVAYLGLVRAVRNYDPSKAQDLLTYAVPTIRGEVLRHFRDHGWTLRPPRSVQELQARISAATDTLATRLGHEPSRAELCEHLGVEPEAYDEATQAFGCFTMSSLDRPLDPDSFATLADLVETESDEGPTVEARVMLAPLIRRLSARDRRIIFLRFFADQTQEEIGQELGVTQMQVSRLLSRIFRDLRRGLGEVSVAS
jgi:RNA polymerase sigma-B factor